MKRVAALLLLICTPAAAQSDAAKSARKQFDDCVYASVGEQWKTNLSTDANTVAELAFNACSTEEQAMYAVLALANLPRPQATAAIIGAKLQIKRTVRTIMADAAKALPKN